MSGLRLSVLSFLFSCGEPGPPMDRLTQAWAAETVARANAPLTHTLVLAAVVSELCVARDEASWIELEVGDPLPVSDMLSDVLGEPLIYSVEGEGTGTAVVVMSGLDLSDHAVEWLRLTVTVTEDRFQVEFDPLIGAGEEDSEVARMEGFGQITLAARSACTQSQALLSGSALWVDMEGRRHELKVPADTDLGTDLSFDGAIPWLPVAGAISWSARIEGQDRSLITEDAAEILVDETAKARWPVTVKGPDWSGAGLSAIEP
jgi:hypothetical protein